MQTFLVGQMLLIVALGFTLAAGTGCDRGNSSQATPTGGSELSRQPSTQSAYSVATAAGIDGRWQRISQEINGQMTEGNLPVVMEIAGNRVTLTIGTRLVGDGTVNIDASKSPKTIDLVVTGRMGSSNGRTETTFGIYQISGGQLVTCFGGDSPATRPKTIGFTSSGETVITKYRRVP